MATSVSKALTWRVTDIPQGTTEKELLKFFEPKDQDRITVCSLCPDVYGGDSLTATVMFRPHPEQPDLGPKLNFHKPPEMEIDKDFLGFTPLYCPEEGIHIAADIIAITGLAGHAFGSWAHSDQKMWLRDYLPKAYAKNARVLTYGYNSHITGDNTSMATLGDLSNSFSDNLINMRDSTQCDQRPIIFIGHSLGCMLIKKSMTSVRIRNVDSSRLPVRALIFLAAPHRGMNIDVLRSVVKDDPPKHLIEELSPDSPTLKEINEAFMEISRDIDILTCFETEKTKPSSEMVITKDFDGYQNSRRHHPGGAAHPRTPTTPNRGMYTDQSHSDNPSPMSGSRPSPLFRHSRTPNTASFITEGQPAYQPADESELNGFDGSPYAQGSPQSLQGSQRNPTMAQGYFNTPGQAPEIHQPMTQTASPEIASFAQNAQAQYSPTPPPPYNQSSSVGRFFPNLFPVANVPVANGCPTPQIEPGVVGEPEQSNANHDLGAQAMRDEQKMTQMFQQMSLSGLDATIQPPGLIAELTNGAADLTSQHSEDAAVGRHPDVFCDECDEEIVGTRYQCQECSSWDYCAECFQSALHPRHQFEAINPPGPNDQDDSAEADDDEDDDNDDDERIGTAQCAYCQMDVVSPSLFLQCAKCSNLELACIGCQNSPTCMNHGEPVEVRQFIWYGSQLSSNMWLSNEPTPNDTALVQALKKQDMDTLDALTRTQQLINAAVDHAGRTPLHIAAHLGLQVCAKFLLMRGANPDLGDKSFCTPLSQAILSRDEDMAFLLLDRGASPNNMDIRGNTPLHLASIAGYIDLAQDFVTNFPALVDKRNKSGETALFRACQVGNFGNARILLNAGADTNTTNDNGATQLGELAASNQTQAVKFLLSTGVDVDRPDGFARTPLYRAAENGHFGLCKILMQHGADPNVSVMGGSSTPLGEAASNGRLKTVGTLIDGGAHIEGRDNRNRTPLFRAAADQKAEICRVLLDRDASPNPGLAFPDESDEECQWGMTPLQIAAFFDLDDVAEVLIEYEVLLEEPDDRGRTALFLAAERGNMDVCQVLLGAGAEVNAQADGSSVLAIAAQRGHFEMVQLLLQQGAKAVPPPSVRGQKWKNFAFDPTVMSGRRQDILELLRAHKHR